MKINEIVIENRERTDELAPLVLPVAGAIAGGALSALELAQQYGEYKDMVRKAKAMPEGDDRQKALKAAENYYDDKYNAALGSLAIGIGAGATMGPLGGLAGKVVGKTATKLGIDPLKTMYNKIFKKGKIDPDKVEDAQKSLDNLGKDKDFQKSLQKVVDKTSKMPAGPTSKIPPKPLKADPADKIIPSTPGKKVKPPKGKVATAVSGINTARRTAAATTATGTTGAVSALQGPEKRLNDPRPSMQGIDKTNTRLPGLN